MNCFHDADRVNYATGDDHQELCELVAGVAKHLLVSGGTLVLKMINGAEEPGAILCLNRFLQVRIQSYEVARSKVYAFPSAAAFFKALSHNFRQVKRFKPTASRSDSRETYLIALGHKAGAT